MKRRHFLQTLGSLSAGIALKKSDLLPSHLPFGEALKALPDETQFWRIVRQQFVFPDDYAYLNTGGIGAVPTAVMNVVKTSMDQGEIAPSPGHSHEKWLETKKKCASLLGTECKEEELALISTATEGINIILNGLPLKKGDEVITSTHEHPALHIPLLNLIQRNGIVIRTFEPDLKSGLGNVDRIERLIGQRTRLIFISDVTCTTGQHFPVKEIGELARAKNLWFALDGAQAVCNTPVDVKECHIDFYAFSGHKWTLGPKRTGVLYVRQELLDTLHPTTVGAYSDDGYDIVQRSLKLHPTAQRYEYATQNEALFHGLGAAVNFIQAIGLKTIWDHNKKLSESFYAGLQTIPDVEILSPEEDRFRTSMITFRMKGKTYQDIASHLSKKRMRVRSVSEANLGGIRVSFHVCNNEDEVTHLLEEIKNLSDI